ncbi:MAG: hypothetical protein MK137_08865, partial [Rickettsiales bacterium]|nr:hypothetical protein [Rickettsiales bacterium]
MVQANKNMTTMRKVMNQAMNTIGHQFSDVAQTVPKYFLRDANHIVELCDDSYRDSGKVIRELFLQLNPSAQFNSGLDQITAKTQLVFINNLLSADEKGLDLLHAVDEASSPDVELIVCVRNIHYWKHIDSFANQHIATSVSNAMNYKAMVQLIEASNFAMLPVIGQRDHSAEFKQFCTKMISFLGQEDERKQSEILSLAAVPYFIVRLVKKQHSIISVMLQSLTLKP